MNKRLNNFYEVDMSTENELKNALDTAMSRIAALESEMRGKPNREPGPAGIDPRKLAMDPINTLRGAGYSDEHIAHIRTVFIADVLGDQAPLQMRMAAAQGPQLVAAQAMEEKFSTLSRRLDDLSKVDKRKSFESISAMKDKYPHLSKVAESDKAELQAQLDSFGGSAEDFAAAQEAKLTKLVAAMAPAPAASVNADNTDQSKKVTPAPLAGSLNAMPPVSTQDKPKGWNAEAAKALRDEIVLKLTSPKV